MKHGTTYHVASKFSRFPGGRKKSHGPYSGEQFFLEVTVPLLKEFEKVTFDLSGSAGYSSGFLDEAFGEIGRIMSLDEALRRLKFLALDDPQSAEIAWSRIKEAAAERQ